MTQHLLQLRHRHLYNQLRSRYLLFKSAEKWTQSQHERAKILFEQYPDLKEAYWLTDGLRKVFTNTPRRSLAATKLSKWFTAEEDSGFKSFKVIAQTFFDNEREILNFFDNRSTNASAESFNCKIKNFRAQLRGVSDVKYFLFRLQNISSSVPSLIFLRVYFSFESRRVCCLFGKPVVSLSNHDDAPERMPEAHQ